MLPVKEPERPTRWQARSKPSNPVPVTAAEELPSRESVAVMAERSGGNLRSEGTANAEGSRSSDPSARMDDLTEDLTNTPGANSTDPVRSGPPLGMVYAPEQPFMRAV